MSPLASIIDLYVLVVLAAVVMSWIRPNPGNPLVQLVYNLTEPVLAPIRRVIPPIGGLDLSPLVLLVILQFLRRLVVF